ncbi:MAG: hypothetical protein QOJ15_1568 [Bradyrhizobium sp.]|jgi:hypothetical protein|nr:hypothetical protein [Bradyrhizobium sp.]
MSIPLFCVYARTIRAPVLRNRIFDVSVEVVLI